jgi:hypothetical protein
MTGVAIALVVASALVHVTGNVCAARRHAPLGLLAGALR